MGKYVNDNKVVISAEHSFGSQNDILEELGSLLSVGRRTDGKYHVADVLSAENMNRWAFNKPIKSSKQVNIDDTDRKKANCGLISRQVTKLLTASIGMGEHTINKDACLAEVARWDYDRPTDRFRIRDMHLYNHNAVAPDADWEDVKVNKEILQKIVSVTVEKNAQPSGVEYTGYNYILQPKLKNGSIFNGAYYNDFSILFGLHDGEEIGNSANMEIPLEYIADDVKGDYRLALAVWIPNYHSNGSGAWGFFISRMTIGYYYGSNNKSLLNLYPDLATNPFLAQLMLERFDESASSTNFDVVPILVKNLSTDKTSENLFYPLIDPNYTAAYCMPSGQKSIKVVCDNTDYVWGKSDYEYIDGDKHAYIFNSDPNEPHTFGYEVYVKLPSNKDLVLERTGEITIAPNTRSESLGDVPDARDYGIKVVIISQDGKAVK